jgi:hypothetical protein
MMSIRDFMRVVKLPATAALTIRQANEFLEAQSPDAMSSGSI